MAKKSPFQLRSGNSPLHQNTDKEGKVTKKKSFDIKGYFKGEQGLIPDYKGKTTAKTATNVSKNIQTQFKSVKKDVTTAAKDVVKAGKSLFNITSMGQIVKRLTPYSKKLKDSYTKYEYNKKKNASEGAAVGGMSGALTSFHKVKKNLKFKPNTKVTTIDSLPVKKMPVAKNRPNIVRPPGYSS